MGIFTKPKTEPKKYLKSPGRGGHEDETTTDVVQRYRVDANGNPIEPLGDMIKRNMGAITGAAAGAMMNNNMNYKDMMKLAATAFVIYKMYQGHQRRQEFFGKVKDAAGNAIEAGVGFAKGKMLELKEEKEIREQERLQLLEDAQKQEAEHKALVDKIKNPLSRFDKTGSYTLNDVVQNIAEKFPYANTETYESMSKKDKKEFDKFQSEQALHRARYYNAFAEKGVDMMDCKFYDFDGNEVKLFESIDSTKKGKAFDMAVAEQNVARDALIYGMDAGQIRCRMPNGEVFNPAEIPSIKNDYYSKHFEDMQAKTLKFADVSAKMDEDIVNQFRAMSEYDKQDFAPAGFSEETKRNFTGESLSTMNSNAYVSSNLARCANGRNPYEVYFESQSIRLASPEEMAERADAEFRKAHPMAGKMKDAAGKVVDTAKDAATAVSDKAKDAFDAVKTAAEQKAEERRQEAIKKAREAGEKLMDYEDFSIPLEAQAMGPDA